jgi:hypothetical protein
VALPITLEPVRDRVKDGRAGGERLLPRLRTSVGTRADPRPDKVRAQWRGTSSS